MWVFSNGDSDTMYYVGIVSDFVGMSSLRVYLELQRVQSAPRVKRLPHWLDIIKHNRVNWIKKIAPIAIK